MHTPTDEQGLTHLLPAAQLTGALHPPAEVQPVRQPGSMKLESTPSLAVGLHLNPCVP